MAKDRVNMPMASAGIIGVSPGTKTSGIEIDPKILVAGILVFIFLVKFSDILVHR